MDKGIEYILEVARCGGITKAAENLFITPSALSKLDVYKRQAESFLLCGGRVQGYHAHRKLVLGTAYADPLLLGLHRGGAFAGT